MEATQSNPSTVFGICTVRLKVITKQWECNLFSSNQCCKLQLYLRDSSQSIFTSVNSKTGQKFIHKLTSPSLSKGVFLSALRACIQLARCCLSDLNTEGHGCIFILQNISRKICEETEADFHCAQSSSSVCLPLMISTAIRCTSDSNTCSVWNASYLKPSTRRFYIINIP